MNHPFRSIIVCASFTTAIAAQVAGAWAELPLSPRPFARERHAMAYDVARGRTVLFGGFNGAYMNDTWELTGTGWVQRSPATVPLARAEHALAYDPVRQRIVLLGGSNGAALTDIWEWDGTNWSQRAIGVVGIGASGSASYDPLIGGVFYNRDNINLVWNGTSANTLTVANPVGGTLGQMVFHAAAGGCLRRIGQFTYRFSLPSGWEDLGFGQTFAVSNYAIAADPVRNRVFLQGGGGSVGNFSGNGVGHSWQWLGASLWSEVSGPLPRRERHAMVFDFGRDAFVMFGGYANGGGFSDDTYVWTEAYTPAQYDAFGVGCSGITGLAPQLRANPLWNSAPVLGGQFIAEVNLVPPGSAVGGAIGLSDTSWGSVPLPQSLASVGMPNCQLLVSPDVLQVLGFANPVGSVNWVTPVPATPALAGFGFFQQAFALVPGANPAGILMSNGAQGIVGN